MISLNLRWYLFVLNVKVTFWIAAATLASLFGSDLSYKVCVAACKSIGVVGSGVIADK